MILFNYAHGAFLGFLTACAIISSYCFKKNIFPKPAELWKIVIYYIAKIWNLIYAILMLTIFPIVKLSKGEFMFMFFLIIGLTISIYFLIKLFKINIFVKDYNNTLI